jgi:hypothetical protein
MCALKSSIASSNIFLRAVAVSTQLMSVVRASCSATSSNSEVLSGIFPLRLSLLRSPRNASGWKGNNLVSPSVANASGFALMPSHKVDKDELLEGSRVGSGNQERHNLTWNGAIARCTRQVPSVIVGIAKDTRNGRCESPLGCSEQQVRHTVTCYFTIWAEVVPKFFSLELNEIPCTPFVVAQHHTPMDHSILPVVCSYDISDSDWCWNIIWTAKTRSKVDITLQHPDGVAIFIPLV